MTVHALTGDDEKEYLTVIINGSASGDLAPNISVIYICACATLIPDGWSFNRSDSGWMTGETFFECVVYVFHPWLLEQAIPLPEALFIDKTMCHM